MIFDVMKANDKNDHDAADIICQECKSIIATLHGPSAHRPGVRKEGRETREMASQEIDRLSDPSATDEERQRRKRRLLNPHSPDRVLNFGAACAISDIAISSLSWIERGGRGEPNG